MVSNPAEMDFFFVYLFACLFGFFLPALFFKINSEKLCLRGRVKENTLLDSKGRNRSPAECFLNPKNIRLVSESPLECV